MSASLLEIHAFRRNKDNYKQCKETIFTNKKELDLDTLAPLIKQLSPQEEIAPIYYGYDFDLGDNEPDYGYVELGAVVTINGSKYNLTMLGDNDDVVDLLYAMLNPEMTEEAFWNLKPSEFMAIVAMVKDLQ